MRYLIEDRDMYNWETKVTRANGSAMARLAKIAKHWEKTAMESQKREVEKVIEHINKVRSNIAMKMYGPGDSVTFEFDGMVMHLSVLEDLSKHSAPVPRLWCGECAGFHTQECEAVREARYYDELAK